MQTSTLTYDLKQKTWSAPFPALDSARSLVLAFGDPAMLDAPEALKELKRAYPLAVVAGCSGSGEIVGTTVRDEVLSVSIAKFDKTSVAAASAPCTQSAQSFAVGEALAKKLNKPSLRSVFVLSDGLNVNGSELVRGLNANLDESVIVTGGLAGDGARFQRTWVSLNELVSSGQVVAIGFYGEYLQVSHGSKGGWDKFGPERVVTRAEGNVLYELDGKPALAMYKEYLGDKASGLPGTGLLFPLSLRANAKDDKALVRTILAVDEAKQSMTFAGDMPVGFLAQLMKADFDRLIGGAATAASTARKLVGLDDANTLAIAVSCVGRRLVLGERTEEEVEAVMEVLPKGARINGFYSYGELSPYATGRCDLHNQTMTLTTFSESASPVTRVPVSASTAAPAPVPSAPRPVAAVVKPPTGPVPAVSPAAANGLKLETFSYDQKQKKWSAPFPALDSARTLVLAFGDPSMLDAPEALKELKRAFPQAVVAGCSGSGEIVGTSVRDEVLSVSVARFEKTFIAAASAPCTQSGQSFAVGEALAKKLNKPMLRAVFVLSDGLNVNGSELVRGLNANLDETVVVTGGLAGDGSRFQRTWVSLNDSVSSGQVVAIGFYGEYLQVSHGSKGGWDKFGPERVVTRAEGNVLYELDGKPALAMYKEYLGDKASGLPGTGLLFPLSLRANAKDDKALVRTILAVDEAKQSMTFAGDMPVGYLAQLMKADFDRLIGGAATAASTARKLVGLDDPNTLALAVSCVGRRLVLGERTEEEVEAVMEVLPKGTRINGFYSYGELSPYATGGCDLHNQTMTLTTFSESATPVARPAAAPRPQPSAPPAMPTAKPVAAKPAPTPAALDGKGLFEDVQLEDSDVRRIDHQKLQLDTLSYDQKSKKWSAPFPALDSARTLVLAFGDPSMLEAPEALKELKRAYPQAIVAGCSGSGEIVGTSVRDEVLSVSIAKFDKTSIAAASAPCTQSAQSFSVGESLAKKLNKPSLRAVFVLSDGLNVNGSELVRGLNANLDETVIVTGGLAGDGARFQRTWVSLNDSVSSGQVVAIGFYGEYLQVSHGSKGGWDKFGPERIVTRSEGNVLFELDGKPALAMYKEYLGDKASGLPGTGLLFPLSLRANAKDDKALVRTILAVDEAKQSMTFAGDVPTGFLAQLMKADFDRLIGGAATAASTARKLVNLEDPNTLALAVSCVGRRLVLGERTEEEVEAVMEVLPRGARVNGFYSYGELSPYATGGCDLHNQTMTLTTFSESATPVPRIAVQRATEVAQPSPSAPLVPRASVPQTRPSSIFSAPPPPVSMPTPSPVASVSPPAPAGPPRSIERRVTRIVGADKAPSPNAVVEIDRSTDVTVVRVKGKLSESFKGREISSLATSKVLFDLAEVERITSFGVREWLQMLGDLEPKSVELYFARCSEAVVNQLGMIRRFSGGGKILSFFAPYLCQACDTQFSTLLDCEVDATMLKASEFPVTDCPSCAQPAHFDDDPKSYLAFGPQPHRAPADVQRAVEALPPVGMADPVEKFIDGRVNRLRVNARIDEALRWPRVFDGLEGEVVLELASSPGTTPQGLAGLVAGLRKLSSDVESVRIEGAPAGMLEALASGPRDSRISIVTALVDGFCASCNARRPSQLRIEEATEALRQGRDPYIVCKRCNSQLTFDGLKAVLERLQTEATRSTPLVAAVVAAPVVAAPVVAAPVPAPAPVAPAARAPLNPAVLALGVMGIVIVGMLGTLLLKLTQLPAVPSSSTVLAPAAVAPTPVAAVVPVPVPVPSANELPPAWSDNPFVVEGDNLFLVGHAEAASTDETALTQARADALLTLIKGLEGRLAGTRVQEYLTAHPVSDLRGNVAPIVARFERQVGSLVAPQRTDTALHKKDGSVAGPVRYRVSKPAFDAAVELYNATTTGFGLTVARFFPTLEASTRTEGEVMVVSMTRGLGLRAGAKEGDVILAVDGRPVASPDAFGKLVREAAVPGSTVVLTVETAGTRRTLKVAIPRIEQH